MRKFLFLVFILSLALISCKDEKHFKLDFKAPADNLKLGQNLEAEVVALTGKTIDSVRYELQGISGVTSKQIKFSLSKILLGKHHLQLKIYA